MSVDPSDVFPAALYAIYDMRYGLLSDVLALKAGQQSGLIVYDTRAHLYADLAYPANTGGMVLADSTSAYNGYYIKTGASGSGSWTYAGLSIYSDIYLPYVTHANATGVIYKGLSPFIHDFNYGNNGTVTTIGNNTFIGGNSGNITMGATATETYHSSYNTAVGADTLDNNTTGWGNTAIGRNVLDDNTTGYTNAGVGNFALGKNTTGNQNVAVGAVALGNNLTGNNNVAVGHWALATNTTSNLVAIGYNALTANTSGTYNTAVGYNALAENVSGTDNTAIGYQAIQNATGGYHTAVGSNALTSNTTGTRNCAFGRLALNGNTTGSYNVSIGNSALQFIVAADKNTALGDYAGQQTSAAENNTTSANSVYLGYFTKTGGTTGATNEIVIGYMAVGLGDNSTVLGNSSTVSTRIWGNVGIGTSSPTRPLDVVGPIKSTGTIKNTVTKNSAYTATINDDVIRVSGDTTILLPSASSCTGLVLTIKKIDTAGTTTTIDGNSSETIDGATTKTLTAQYAAYTIQSNGTSWDILSHMA